MLTKTMKADIAAKVVDFVLFPQR